MNENITEIVEKIETAFNVMANKLGIGVEHFWPLFVKQQKVEAWTNIIAWGVVAIIVAFFGILLISYGKKIKEKCNDDSCMISGYVILTLDLIVYLAVISINILGVINPEYYALKEIMWMIR